MQPTTGNNRSANLDPQTDHQHDAARILRSRVDRRAYHVLNLCVLLLLALLALSIERQDRLPPPDRLVPELADEPDQEPTNAAPFDRTVDGMTYHIVPVASYDLKGLVVSYHDSKNWLDEMHKSVGDFINVDDVCVVWGANATTGVYQDTRFSNGEFTCQFNWKNAQAEELFKTDAVSNNHLLADDPRMARSLRSLRIGDQIRLKGYLVNYANATLAPDAYRNTSTVRTDTGNGACEVIYVTDLQTFHAATRIWSMLRTAVYAGLLLSLVVWLWLPYRGSVS